MNENEIQLENAVNYRNYAAEITEIIRGKATPKLIRERISDYHENDIASAADEMSRDERKKLISVLDDETLASVLEYSENMAEFINELPIRRKIAVLSSFDTSVTAEYLQTIEKTERQTLLDLMSDDIRGEVALISSFDEDEIGSRMTTNYVNISEKCTVTEAMRSLVEQAADNDNISTLYVTDDDGLLYGAIDLKDLIVARKGDDLKSITMTSYPYVYANEMIDDCIERIKDYSEDSIPVLDPSNKLVGVLISQDITHLVDDEMGDDYAKLAGLSAEEDLNEPLKKSIGKRLPWLIILLGLGLLVSGVVGLFENVISDLTLIVCFQSLILGMAGNAGTQSLAVTIRVLMDEELGMRKKLYLIGKEARAGLVNGLILGALSVGFIGLYITLFKGYPMPYAFSVSLCTGIALAVSILISGVTGTVVPLIFKHLKVDPAVASGPLITTVNDLVAVVSYYGLAWFMLIYIAA